MYKFQALSGSWGWKGGGEGKVGTQRQSSKGNDLGAAQTVNNPSLIVDRKHLSRNSALRLTGSCRVIAHREESGVSGDGYG